MLEVLIEIALLFTLIFVSAALFVFERRKLLGMTAAERREYEEGDQDLKIY